MTDEQAIRAEFGAYMGDAPPSVDSDWFVDLDKQHLDGELWAVSPKEGVMSAQALHHVRKGLREAAPEKRFVVFAGPVDLVSVTSLDAAWRAVEAALPEGWELETVGRYVGQATITAVNAQSVRHTGAAATHDAALRALLALLPTQASDSPEKTS